MLQAIGLTSTPRRDQPAAVDDLTFEARPGTVTALLGASGAGKTMTLRLMLGLEQGRGVAYFRGRPLHRIANPACEVGVLLGDVPGHPGRTAKGQLRMLCAAAGVPASRADELLDVVGLGALRDERLGNLSLGMDRRLGIASALLGDPHTLLLDAPSAGLSPRETRWLHGLLHAHAAQGGTVLFTTDDPKEAARTADRIVTIDAGRLVADQDAAAFSGTRLRPRVAIRTPHAARLADALSKEARARQRSLEVVADGGSRLTVYGSSCPEIGETAFRHGVLVHQLADEIGDCGPVPAARQSGEDGVAAESVGAGSSASAGSRVAAVGSGGTGGSSGSGAAGSSGGSRGSGSGGFGGSGVPGGSVLVPLPVQATGDAGALPPALEARPARGPLRPVRYELRRMFGVRTAPLIGAAVLCVSLALSLVLARTGSTPPSGLLAAWPALLPLPPAAMGAGLIGALSYGDEHRHPALAGARGTVPRRLGLLVAKLLVTGAVAVLLALLTAAADGGALRLLYGSGAAPVPHNWPALCAGWAGLALGCAWAGLLGAGVFRITAAGVTAVVAVPVLVVPLVKKLLAGPAAHPLGGLADHLPQLRWLGRPHGTDGWLLALLRLVTRPEATALALSLTALFCAFAFTGLRRRARW